MRSAVTAGAAWSVCLSVGLSIMIISPEPMEMPFGMLSGVGPRKYVLDGGRDTPCAREILRVKGASHCKAYWPFAVSYPKKTAEPIEIPFGIWTWVGPRKLVLDIGAHWRHMANTIEPSMCGGDAAFLSHNFDHLFTYLLFHYRYPPFLLNGLWSADVLLRNSILTHPLTHSLRTLNCSDT